MTLRRLVTLTPVLIGAIILVGCGVETPAAQTPAEREQIREQHKAMSQAESGQR